MVHVTGEGWFLTCLSWPSTSVLYDVPLSQALST